MDKLYDTNPRVYALDLCDSGVVSFEHLATCLLKHMTPDEVRDCLDKNDLSPDGFRRNMEG